MVRLTYIALFISTVFFGCGSSKSVSKSGNQLDYKKQKAFEASYFSANKEKVLGNNEKAIELYTKALDIHPESHASMYQLAKLFYKDKKYNEALYWAEKSVATSPKFNHWYSGQLAQFYNKFGKYDKSAAEFAKMVEKEPNVRQNYTEAASQYFNAKMTDKAISYLKLMQERFGVELESASRLDYIYSSIGKKDKSVDVMEELVESDPYNIQYLGFLAETYMNAGYTEKAINTLNKVLSLEPETGKAYYALYTIYSDQNKKELALKNLKESFKYDDISLKQKLQSVTPIFSRIKGNEEARNLLLELSDILLDDYPTELEPYMFRADIHGTVGQHELARKYVRKALEIDNTDFRLWGKLLDLNTHLEDDKAQLAAVDEALEIFPNMPQLYVAKGMAYLGAKEYQKAIDITDEGLDIAVNKEDKAQLLQCQASAYSRLKNYIKSDKTFDKILELNPYNPTALNNYAFNLAERKVRLDEADSMINIALKIEPNNPYFLDTKAWILFGKKDYKQALKILDKCMEIDPKNPEYYRHAKEIFLEMGNETMARDMQDKIDAVLKK